MTYLALTAFPPGYRGANIQARNTPEMFIRPIPGDFPAPPPAIPVIGGEGGEIIGGEGGEMMGSETL